MGDQNLYNESKITFKRQATLRRSIKVLSHPVQSIGHVDDSINYGVNEANEPIMKCVNAVNYHLILSPPVCLSCTVMFLFGICVRISLFQRVYLIIC